MSCAVRNLSEIVPVCTAWKMASETPAKKLNAENEMGVLRKGRLASLAVLSRDFVPIATFVRGKRAFSSTPPSAA